MYGVKKLTLHNVLENRICIMLLLLLATMAVITASALLSVKTVTVIDNGKVIATETTLKSTVGSFIEKSGITLGEFDEISPSLEIRLAKNQTINVERAFPLEITVADQTVTVNTTSKTVSTVLERNNIILGEMDLINPPLYSVVTADTPITITKVSQDMTAVEEPIAYETISTPNRNMERGKTTVIEEGENGIKEIMYNIVYHNGEEVSREVVGERIVKEPKNQVEQYGTQYQEITSRGGVVRRSTETVSDPENSLSYSQVLTCRASAYDLSYESCGKLPGDPYYGIAASGMKVSRGVVAVDPSVIPMGSKLYIESTDSWPDYGYAIAGDKGGAIKGNRIDLFMESRSEAYSFGRRNVKVYILN